ncbi:MAG: aminodeoxychorismate synthase component I [Oxalobacteraceae bacterium]|nr:aminodeoxychorismate synthase component I [Oxalobacteraceae bacterium]
MPGISAVIDFSAPCTGLTPIALAFGTPQEELVARTPCEVLPVLEAVEQRARQGLWCVGYLRYEAAAAFDSKFALHEPDGPLVYFAIHRSPVACPNMAHDLDRAVHWSNTLERQEFDSCVARIRKTIEAGEVYQVNYTAPLIAEYRGDPFDLFCALKRSQPRSNAAFIATPEEHVLSLSPELFFDWDGATLTCAPMKGTAPRGPTPEIDATNARELRESAKERAENVMIVDLVRNDLSRIAELGSVNVTRLFECHAWPTVWQMISVISAKTRRGITIADVFASLFPCGSITGAPKLRAMHWIRNLERGPRGVYCGAVGFVQPGGAARFNVPIRTLTVRHGRATCGIGSGITWSSAAGAEWSEWTHKAGFLDQAREPFQLLQTLRLDNGECRHLEMHLDRLEAAAAHFGFPFARASVRDKTIAAAWAAPVPHGRIRIHLDCRGIANVETSSPPLAAATPPTVMLAMLPMCAPSAFLHHKTTRRGHYAPFEADSARVFDSLLWNEHGEVTEFTRGSVVIERQDGVRVTPPLTSGLLDGVGRALAVATGQVREEIVKVTELADARRLWFVNSLRGWIEVRLEGAPPETMTTSDLHALGPTGDPVLR